jgi:heme/copper-type cytochrome/quinol oxidase subunit 4
VGQDIVNIFPVSLLLIGGGLLLLLNRKYGIYLLAFTPLFMFYYALSYAMGWEWMAPGYSGNSHFFFFFYLFVLITGLILLMYCLANLPKDRIAVFKRLPLALYSLLMCVFLAVFAKMWMAQILDLYSNGTTLGYDIAPAAFWLVRTIDLGFCIPLGFISVYLLWTAAARAYAIQFLFYGFFVTQILAVCAMGINMYLQKDPGISSGELGFFLLLAVLIITGFIYVISNYKKKIGEMLSESFQ